MDCRRAGIDRLGSWICRRGVFLLHQGDVIGRLSPSGGLCEAWERLLLMAAFLSFAIYVKCAIIRLKQARAALQQSEQRYCSLAEATQDLVLVIGRDGRIQYANSFAAKRYGIRPEQLIGRRRGGLWKRHETERQRAHLEKVLQTGASAYSEFPVPLPENQVWLATWLAPIQNSQGEVVPVLEVCRDITQRKLQEGQLAYLATHDPLTGLPNRRVLDESLARVAARARRGTVSSFLFMDVDNFKVINDTFGHASGDQALVGVSALIQKQLRSEDLLVRLGGDEFVVLLEGTGLEEASVVAERIRRGMEGYSLSDEGQEFHLSIGLMIIDGEEDPSKVLSKADRAMYRAKERGSNRVEVYVT